MVAMKVCGTVMTMSPGLHAGGHQRKAQRVGSAAHADAMLRVAECREFAFEILDHRAADEAGGAECLLERRPAVPSSSS